MGRVAVIGGGPAGLMAAEVLAEAGHAVTVFEALPSVGRKLLMAGKSGLNITHGEDHAALLTRYGAAEPNLREALDAFTARDVIGWCAGLGVETFVGSSGRVFPTVMKASPLLRAWLARLDAGGVRILTRHRWTGFSGGALTFETPEGALRERFHATVLALGGASWPRLGSDGSWSGLLSEEGVALAPFRPANCGFEVAWSQIFVERFAGEPVKAVIATSAAGSTPGEFVVTKAGIEGSLVYAHSAALRDALDAAAPTQWVLDLVPGRSVERLEADLARQPKKLSLSNRLRKGAGLDAVKTGLLREGVPDPGGLSSAQLAAAIKATPITLEATRPMAEAISVAGGVRLGEIDTSFMLIRMPGIFVAGEMLDWEAPTGGYLLTACLATGRAAARGVISFLGNRPLAPS